MTPTSFTHVDPFEDTERLRRVCCRDDGHPVSPTSIRSRILKGVQSLAGRFVHYVSPTSIRSRILKAIVREWALRRKLVSPTSIRSRILKAAPTWDLAPVPGLFHPRRSVRGY